MRLTERQTEILEKAKARIDYARANDFYTWYRLRFNCATLSNTEIDEREDKEAKRFPTLKDYAKNCYEAEKNGITLVTANTKTIKKLAEFGLITIEDEGGRYPDRIKVIGY